MDPAGSLPEVVALRGCLPGEDSFMKQLTGISESKQITKSQLKNFETTWMALTKNSQISRTCLDAVGNILQRLGTSAPEGVQASWNAINTADQAGRSALARSPTSQTKRHVVLTPGKPRAVSPPRTSPSAQSTPPMTEATFTEQLNAIARSTQITKSQLAAFATSWNALISTGQPISKGCFIAVGKVLDRLGTSAPKEVKDSWGEMAAKSQATAPQAARSAPSSPFQVFDSNRVTDIDSIRLATDFLALNEQAQSSALKNLSQEGQEKLFLACTTALFLKSEEAGWSAALELCNHIPEEVALSCLTEIVSLPEENQKNLIAALSSQAVATLLFAYSIAIQKYCRQQPLDLKTLQAYRDFQFFFNPMPAPLEGPLQLLTKTIEQHTEYKKQAPTSTLPPPQEPPQARTTSAPTPSLMELVEQGKTVISLLTNDTLIQSASLKDCDAFMSSLTHGMTESALTTFMGNLTPRQRTNFILVYKKALQHNKDNITTLQSGKHLPETTKAFLQSYYDFHHQLEETELPPEFAQLKNALKSPKQSLGKPPLAPRKK